MKFHACLAFPILGTAKRPASVAWGRILAAVLLLMQRPVGAEPAGASGQTGPSGLYAGVGIADVQGSARASGSLTERESDGSAALRLALGYAVALSNRFSIGPEIYDLPTHAKLGLGDETTNIVGLAILPAYVVLPDTTLFLAVGVERARTNSPVSDWRTFSTNTPVCGAGISYSFARILGIPVSLSGRVERANYERITDLGQTDLLKQTRYLAAVEWHF
jgi:hypothetical protein